MFDLTLQRTEPRTAPGSSLRFCGAAGTVGRKPDSARPAEVLSDSSPAGGISAGTVLTSTRQTGTVPTIAEALRRPRFCQWRRRQRDWHKKDRVSAPVRTS